MTYPRNEKKFVTLSMRSITITQTLPLARERSGESPPSGHFRRDEPGDAPPNKNLPYNP